MVGVSLRESSDKFVEVELEAELLEGKEGYKPGIPFIVLPGPSISAWGSKFGSLNLENVVLINPAKVSLSSVTSFVQSFPLFEVEIKICPTQGKISIYYSSKSKSKK